MRGVWDREVLLFARPVASLREEEILGPSRTQHAMLLQSYSVAGCEQKDVFKHVMMQKVRLKRLTY